MALTGETIDIIATRILLEAQDAIANLSGLDSAVNKSLGRVGVMRDTIKKMSEEAGVSTGNVARLFREMNQAKGGKIGVLGVTDKEIARGELVARMINQHEAALERLNTKAEKLAANSAKFSEKELLARQNKINKEIAAEEKKFERLSQLGEKEAQRNDKIMEREAAARARAAQQAALPQNTIPAFVQKQFGDINSYIAQSSNKIEAWKNVVTQSANAAGVNFEKAGTELKKMVSGASVQPLNSALRELGNTGKSAFEKIVNSARVLQISFGILISMLAREMVQAFVNTFKTASDQAKQLEETTYRLANAERVLSVAGQDITLQGLGDGITRVQKLLPIFSREDVSQLVGQIALGTQQLGYSEKQIIDLTQAVALYNIQSTKNEDLATTASHIMSAILGKSSQGIAQLGISFNKTEKEAAALNLGLIEQGESLENLTDDELAAVKLAILLKNANVDNAEAMELLNDFLDSNSGKIQKNSSAWKDLLTTIGQGINNMIPALDGLFTTIQKSIEVKGIQKLFATTLKGVEKFDSQNKAIIAKLSSGIALTQKEYDKLKNVLSGLSDKEILKIFPDPFAIKDQFTRELVQSLVDIRDTATTIPDPLIPEVDPELANNLEEIDQKIQDIILDAQHAREDLEVLLAQKTEDIGIKFTQKTEDINTDYNQKGEDAASDDADNVVDINQDAQNKIEDALAQSHDEQIDAEQKFQQELKQLRMRFLLDLEDALHERDARAVIRLQRQFQFDKKALAEKKKIDSKASKDKLAEELAAIEEEKQQKLEAAQIEYQRKLEDLAIAKQRELEELNVWKQRELAELALWHSRELAEIDLNVKQKLESLLAGYIAEGKLHEENQAAIQAILVKYFGEDMALINDLADFMAERFAQIGAMAAQSVAALVQAGSLLNALGAQVGSVAYNPFAGGLELPTFSPYSNNNGYIPPTPTPPPPATTINTPRAVATFGGNSFQPSTASLGGLANNRPNPSQGNRGGGINGQIAIAIDLSPDLEARIVENSMNGVAEVVLRVNRSKV